MIENYKMVAEFMEISDQPILASPAIPAKERCELRISLINEELNELKQAIKDGDLVGIADAFADLKYVLFGSELEFGMGGIAEECFAEVHRSNMTKTCDSLKDAEIAQDIFWAKDGTVSLVHKIAGKYVLLRKPDGKLLKPHTYSPANLKQFINA